MLKESDDPDKLGVTFDSEMTFEKHLRLVSRASSQLLGIYSAMDSFLGDDIGVLSCCRCIVQQ